jgi:histidyl-tRNA synthetase
VLSLELEGIAAEEPLLDVFVAAEPGRDPHGLLAELRAAGLSADTDYAGRSMKGQISTGEKRARAVVVLEGDAMTLRRRGEQDVQVDAQSLEELLRS